MMMAKTCTIYSNDGGYINSRTWLRVYICGVHNRLVVNSTMKQDLMRYVLLLHGQSCTAAMPPVSTTTYHKELSMWSNSLQGS
jgi:hypothetical protein